MKNRLFRLSDIVEFYGVTKYEAQTIMNNVKKINVGRGTQRPRWVARQEEIELFLHRNTQTERINGLDERGNIIRRKS